MAAPQPQWRKGPGRYFSQQLGCLVLDWFCPCCQRGGWGGEWTGFPGVWALLSFAACGAGWSLSVVCTLCPLSLVLWGPEAQTCVAGRGGL